MVNMDRKKGIAIAPLIFGIIFIGQSLRQLAETGFSMLPAIILISGVSAVLVGVGIIFGWRDFETGEIESNYSVIIGLSFIGLCSFGVGVAFVLI